MRSRTKGRATKCPWLYEGIALGWETFGEFRAWAITHGFSKVNNSPDRLDPTRGYVPDNVEFRTPGQNYAAARGSAYYAQSDDAVRGQEPPDEVPF